MSERVGGGCHYCGLPIPKGDRPIAAKTGNAVAHFECWYDGGPFAADKRDPETGALPREIDRG